MGAGIDTGISTGGKRDRSPYRNQTFAAQLKPAIKPKTSVERHDMGDKTLFLGKSLSRQHLDLKYANRHGLIAGATGTGKTVTLQILAEGLAKAGVAVFAADVKGDLAGLSQPGEAKEALRERAEAVGLKPYEPEGFSVCFWDLHGSAGHSIRTTVSEMGPLLLARLMDLNDTQEGVLTLAFRFADDNALLLLDLKDLRALLVHIADHPRDLKATYGHISKASVGAIQRRLLALEEQGAEKFFGEPALDIQDLINTDENGRGVINILSADRLMQAPKLYATFLLWLLSELFEELPEIGDMEKPRLVFFFDEAHLLFKGAPKALLEKIETVVRLIRSKGVGVFFVTQNPLDIPDSVSSQLGNRILHALRAFTPREQKVIRAAADTFRPNPDFRTIDAITELGVGEALVSTLGAKGAPSMVERTLIRPPSSRMGVISISERAEINRASPMARRYASVVDRESAYEILHKRAEASVKAREKTTSSSRPPTPRRSNRQGYTEAAAKSFLRSLATGLAREIQRGVLGGLRKR